MTRQIDPNQYDWHVVRTKPPSPALAATHLSRQGFAVLDAWRAETRRRQSKLKTVRAPLFPGYLLVGVDADSSAWPRIRSTRGVIDIIQLGPKGPALVAPDLVALLLAQCGADGEFVPGEVALSAGDDVKVAHGPFAGLIGRLADMDGEGRVAVLMDILGKQQRVRMRRQDLRGR